MLKAPSEFPHPGAVAYVAPHGEQVRIIQANDDGSRLIAHQRPHVPGSASDTRTVPLSDLYATQEAAIGKRPASGRGARRSGATTKRRRAA